jgi:hypothetical protein
MHVQVGPMEEHRGALRRRTLKEGKAVLSDTQVIDCRIRDMSDSGARIEFASAFELPKEFRLVIVSTNSIVPVELAWQRGPLAGVRFTGPGEPAPRRV